MNKNILFGGIITIILVGGFLFFNSQSHQTSNNTPTSSGQTEGKMVAGYNGKVLAGTTSPYIIFNKADYQKALASDKVVFLDFFANWCPICREEAPVLTEGFNSLKSDKIIGFRINWNDSDTTDDDKAMASQYGIAQQHTKVFIKNGKEITRTLESWTKDEFAKQMNAFGVH